MTFAFIFLPRREDPRHRTGSDGGTGAYSAAARRCCPAINMASLDS